MANIAEAPLTSLPQLHSLPSATAKLFLDFDGHFEASWGSRTNASTPAFDQDGDPTTFSASELASINQIWARVSEDYAPFNIDVTTVDPGNQANGVTAVIAIGGSYSDWYGSAAGGVAFIGGFYNLSSNVGYVFSSSLSGSAKNTSEAASHEAGHLFGLQHQASWSGSTLVAEYNSGNGAWAPLMGVGYSATRTTWYNGPTAAGPTAFQDEMSILAGNFNAFGYRPDDFGGTIATASNLPTIGTSVNFSGLIGQANDLDVWSFNTPGGLVTFQLTGAQFGTNLDAILELRNSSGATIVSDAPSNSLGASLTTTIGAGTYYLVTRSVGDYGDVGQYTITGSLPNGQPTPPTIQFQAASFSANEDDGTTSVVTLSRSGDVSIPSQVQVTLAGGTATAGSDYSTAGFPLLVNFAANQTTQTVPLTLVNDTLVEGLQTVQFQVSSLDNAVIGTRSSATLNITDADTATVAFQAAGTSIGEEDPVGSLVLVLTTAPGNTLESGTSFTVSATNGSAENTDYDSATFPKTVTFTAGQGHGATQTVAFDPASDTLLEGDEMVTLSIASGPLLTGSGQTTHLVTIKDADTATIAFQQAATTVGEDDPATALTLVLATAPGNTLENGATLSVNATALSAENTDYDSATFPKTVTFTAGQGHGATQTVSFDPASDTLLEGDETVSLSLTNGALLTASGQTTHLVTIRDADTATIAFQQAATTVGEDDPATALTLVLATAPGNTLENGTTIAVSATLGSAETADYDSATFPKTVTFTAGQGHGATQTVAFDPASDNLIEGDETVTLSLTNGPLLTASGQTANLLTIHDADTASIAFQQAATNIGEDDPAPALALVLTTAPGNTLENNATIPITATGSSAETTDYDSATFPKTITFAAGQANGATQTFSIAPTSDNLIEGDEAVTLAITNGLLLTAGSQASQLLTIRDADTATIAFQQAATTVGEDDPATALTLVLATAPGNTLENGATITINATALSAETTDFDSTDFSKTITFTAGQGHAATQIVSFDPASDSLIEGDETVTLSLINDTLLTGSGQITNLVTIRDADAATISFQQSTTTISEDDPSTLLSLVLSTTPGNTLENDAAITVTAANGTAENTDYDSEVFLKTISFAASQGNGATQIVGFDPASDNLIEGDETVSLSLVNGLLLTASGQTTHLITLRDADTASIIVVPGQTVGEDGSAQPIAVRLLTTGGNTLESPLTVSLNAAAAAGTETADATFGALGNLSFPAGADNNSTSTSLSFTPNPDTLIEGSELALISVIGDSLNGQITYSDNEVTIRDADSATISFQTASSAIPEEDHSQSLVLALTTVPGNTLENAATITINATDDSAENADYDSDVFPKSIVFPAGQGNGTTQTVTFDPANDALVEGDETVNLSISSGFLLSEGGQTTHTVTIIDGAVITDEDMPINIALNAGEASFAPVNYQMVGLPEHGTLSGTFPDLTYSPTRNFNGTDSFVVTVNAGSPNANNARIRLVVRSVNDEPSFSLASEVSVTDESLAQSIANWASNISGGPADATDESTQSVKFMATADNAALFQEQPTIDADGTLHFVPHPNVNGSAQVTVRLTDDSGTENGGADTSAPLSFYIHVAKARVWHNADRRWDVNHDGLVVANDVLDTINFINASGAQQVPTIKTAAGPYYDTTGDGWVAADDVLEIINHINAFGADAPTDSRILTEPTLSLPASSIQATSARLPLDELITLLASDVADSAKRRK